MMSTDTAWHRVVEETAPGQHVAQLYTDPDFLARAVARFAGTGLRDGEGVIAVATARHWRAIRRRLERDGLDLHAFQDRQQLVVLDAEDTLASFMDGGTPDRPRFRVAIGGVIDDVRNAGFRRVRAFGEMVDILRRSDLAATLRLEELWNELLIDRGVALLCGYSLDAFDRRIYRGILQQVSASHSDLIPVDDYDRLERAVDRAYAEVFGGGTDSSGLRRALLQHYPRPAAMPDAAASMLAARDLVPDSADALLDSVRRYYHMGGTRRAPQTPLAPQPG
jgi:hypothetical protein